MQRRTILVDFFWTRDKDPRIPLGHASILTALRNEGVDVRSVVVAVNEDHSAADVVRRVLEEAEGCTPEQLDVAFGAYVWGEDLLQEVLPLLRAAGFAGRVVLGGPQISYSGRGLERVYPDADVFIRGYGEGALAALVKTAEPTVIPGVHWAGTPDLVIQAAVDLKALPSPWQTGTIPLGEHQAFVRWETQRGCPFKCAFCQHREAGARLRQRALLLGRVEAEIDLLCESKVRDIAVLDPIFNMAPHAVAVLNRFAERGYKGRLSLQCRAETTSDAFLVAASALDVCLEFGLQTIHPEEGRAIQRGNKMSRVSDTLAAVRAYGLRHEVSLIFGLPLQTLGSFQASVAWCLERQIPVIKAFPLMLLRGTHLERTRDTWALEDSGGAMPMVLQSSSFDRHDWQAMARISEALRLTEGRHPSDINTLLALAEGLEPEIFRWIPEEKKEAA